jgi:hypothetical protein
MIEWYRQYLEYDDEFIPTNLVVKVGKDGALASAGQFDEANVDHHFGGKYVGKHIEWREDPRPPLHSPVYLENDTGRFYVIRSRDKE